MPLTKTMKPSNSYAFFQCCDPQCGLRFPSPGSASPSLVCPRCKSTAAPIPLPEDLFQNPPCQGSEKSPKIEALLDNIRSTFNLGAMFRTADGAGISHLYLCGITPKPENPKVNKTALGAEFAVPWSYSPNGLQTATTLRASQKCLWALEIGPSAVSLYDAIPELGARPLVLVVGNENAGIDPEIRALCEKSIYIPMQGYKRSLNVAIAFGIAVYTFRFGLPTNKNTNEQKSIDPLIRTS